MSSMLLKPAPCDAADVRARRSGSTRSGSADRASSTRRRPSPRRTRAALGSPEFAGGARREPERVRRLDAAAVRLETRHYLAPVRNCVNLLSRPLCLRQPRSRPLCRRCWQSPPANHRDVPARRDDAPVHGSLEAPRACRASLPIATSTRSASIVNSVPAIGFFCASRRHALHALDLAVALRTRREATCHSARQPSVSPAFHSWS